MDEEKNIYTRTYNYTLLADLFAVEFYVGMTIPSEGFPMKFISDFFLGAMLGFLMIPLHEWLHGIAYKTMGAQSVQYRVDWKKVVL